MMPLSRLKVPHITMTPHTLGNELQVKILASSRLSNLLLIYLAVFFTIKLLGVDK